MTPPRHEPGRRAAAGPTLLAMLLVVTGLAAGCTRAPSTTAEPSASMEPSPTQRVDCAVASQSFWKEPGLFSDLPRHGSLDGFRFSQLNASSPLQVNDTLFVQRWGDAFVHEVQWRRPPPNATLLHAQSFPRVEASAANVTFEAAFAYGLNASIVLHVFRGLVQRVSSIHGEPLEELGRRLLESRTTISWQGTDEEGNPTGGQGDHYQVQLAGPWRMDALVEELRASGAPQESQTSPRLVHETWPEFGLTFHLDYAYLVFGQDPNETEIGADANDYAAFHRKGPPMTQDEVTRTVEETFVRLGIQPPAFYNRVFLLPGCDEPGYRPVGVSQTI